MKVKNIVVDPSQFFVNKQLNRSYSISFYNYNNIINKYGIDLGQRTMKLSNVINKTHNKKVKNKYFKFWKKGEK